MSIALRQQGALVQATDECLYTLKSVAETAKKAGRAFVNIRIDDYVENVWSGDVDRTALGVYSIPTAVVCKWVQGRN